MECSELVKLTAKINILEDNIKILESGSSLLNKDKSDTETSKLENTIASQIEEIDELNHQVKILNDVCQNEQDKSEELQEKIDALDCKIESLEEICKRAEADTKYYSEIENTNFELLTFLEQIIGMHHLYCFSTLEDVIKEARYLRDTNEF